MKCHTGQHLPLICKSSIKYNIFRTLKSEQVFLPRIDERMISMQKEYIEKITSLLPYADIDLLDFIYQVLQKSVAPPLNPNPSKEHPQSA